LLGAVDVLHQQQTYQQLQNAWRVNVHSFLRCFQDHFGSLNLSSSQKNYRSFLHCLHEGISHATADDNIGCTFQ
jgi:hypothetical protein